MSLLLFPTRFSPIIVIDFFFLRNLGEEAQMWKMALSSWNYCHLNE